MVAPLDLKCYKTANNLGGAITATEIKSATFNNLFSNVPRNDLAIGRDYFACCYFKNTHATEGMDNFKLWLSSKSVPKTTETDSFPTIYLDGVNGQVDLTNDATLWSQALTKFSFSFDFYIVSFAGATDRYIVNHGSASNHSIRFILGTNNKVRLQIKNLAGTNITSETPSTITLAEWHKVVCVYDNSLANGNMKVYLDGVLQGTGTNLTETINLSATMVLGHNGANAPNIYIKNFRWWTTTPLSQQNVTDLYNGWYILVPTPSYWLPAYEGAGNPVDRISGSKIGTLSGGATWDRSSPKIPPMYPDVTVKWAYDRLNFGYRWNPNYNATGAVYDETADDPAYDLSGDITVMCWFKTSATYSTEGCIVNKGGFGTDTAGENMNYGIWITTNGHIMAGFEETNGTEHYCESSNSYNDGVWHWALLWYRKSESLVRLYIDDPQSEVGTHSTNATPETNAKPIRIGANSRAADRYFTGRIDEVRIWNRSVTYLERVALREDNVVNPNGLVFEKTFGANDNSYDAQTIPDQYTSPKLITWRDVESEPEDPDFLTVWPGQTIPIWIWLHVNANAVPRLDDSEGFGFQYNIEIGGTGTPGDDQGGGGTDPGPLPDYSLCVSGDWGCENETDDVIKLMRDKRYGQIISVGDLAYEGSKCWLDAFAPLRDIFISCMGNHEMSNEDNDMSKYLSFLRMSKSYGVKRWKNWLFLIIDSNINMDSGSTQNDFFKNELEKAKNDNSITWRAAVFHHAMYGSNSEHDYNDGNSVEAFHEMFEQYNVNFAFVGHNHNLQRSHQVKYKDGSPLSPIVVDSSPPFTRNHTVIEVVSGAGGHDDPGSLYSLGSKPAFMAYQARNYNGVWEVLATNNGKTLTCSFVEVNGDKHDTFVYNA